MSASRPRTWAPATCWKAASGRVGARVRVNVQFIDALNGHHLWAEKFDREIEDIFDLQDEITHYIAATVAPELEKAEWNRAQAVRPKDMTAWACCLQGRALMAEFSRETNDQARALFQKAIELDPELRFGLRRAWPTAITATCGSSSPNSAKRRFRRLLEAARQGVKLDQGNSEAHSASSASV